MKATIALLLDWLELFDAPEQDAGAIVQPLERFRHARDAIRLNKHVPITAQQICSGSVATRSRRTDRRDGTMVDRAADKVLRSAQISQCGLGVSASIHRGRLGACAFASS